jgi:hypothetical protein
VQCIGRQVWKWSVSFDADVSARGQAAIKSEAVAEAERAIDRVLAPKKLRLVPPGSPDWHGRLRWQICATLHGPSRIEDLMTDIENPFSDLDLQQAIDLRWTLRDIRAKRWKLSPISISHMEKLVAMGLVEMRNDEPALTNSGQDAIF